MDFPDSYLKGEIREGFYVESMMKKAWAAQIEVLSMIDEICQKYHIQYFADWGTLLGTIRHKGFIPWDDDMDITMKRKDYERFIEVAKKELPPEFQIVNAYTATDWNHLIARVVNESEIRLDREFLLKYHGCPYVVGLDIFILDYVPQNKEEDQMQCKLLEILLLAADSIDNKDSTEEETLHTLKEIEEMCGVKLDYSGDIANQLRILGDQISKLYSEEESDCVAIMYDHAHCRPGDVYPKEWYEESIRMPFENTTIPVPVGYENILKIKYGENYMTPMMNTSSHNYPFYKKVQQKMAYDVLGYNPH